MTDRTYLVAEIKAALEARGQQWKTNEDAAQITWRVAWALRADGAMLIRKRPEQNGAVHLRVLKYSHDSIAFPSGWIDCLRGAGPPDNENAPVWNPTGASDAPLAAPFDLDAGWVTDPPPRPTDPLPPAPEPLGLLALLNEMHGSLKAIQDDVAAVKQTQALGLDNRYIGALTVPPPPKKKP